MICTYGWIVYNFGFTYIIKIDTMIVIKTVWYSMVNNKLHNRIFLVKLLSKNIALTVTKNHFWLEFNAQIFWGSYKGSGVSWLSVFFLYCLKLCWMVFAAQVSISASFTASANRLIENIKNNRVYGKSSFMCISSLAGN